MTKKEKKPSTKNKLINVPIIIEWFREKNYRWIIALIALAGILWMAFVRPALSSNRELEYQTAEVQRGDLIAIVGATGIVEPQQSVDLYWQTTGRVESVNKKIGDVVELGDILANLADTSLPQSVILAQADLVDAQRELDNLINSETERAEAYENLLLLEKDLRTATDDRDKWNYKDTDWDLVYESRASFILAEEELKTAQKAYDAVANLEDDNQRKIAAQNKLAEKQTERDQAIRRLNNLLGKLYDQEVAEDFSDYDLVAAKLDDAQREWERLINGPNADDIRAAEARVAAAETTIAMGWLEAPINGTITRAVPKIGDFVDTGDLGFRIDDLSRQYIKVDISEVDVNRISAGQNAELTFDGITGKTYAGIVTEVSTVGEDLGNGVVFEVTVEILDADDQVRPGMTAAVNIIVKEIKNVLVVPNRAIRLNNGQRIVYLLKDGQLNEVAISIGSSSDTQSEILDGDLDEGDLVVLNPPMTFQTNGGPPPFMGR